MEQEPTTERELNMTEGVESLTPRAGRLTRPAHGAGLMEESLTPINRLRKALRISQETADDNVILEAAERIERSIGVQ